VPRGSRTIWGGDGALVPLLLYPAVVVAPVLALWAMIHLFGPLVAARLNHGRGLRTSRPPIERIGADLHRLAADYARAERSNQPGKLTRLRAAGIAYDDLLVAACFALDVPTPRRLGHEPLDAVDRLTLEAELARAGLSW